MGRRCSDSQSYEELGREENNFFRKDFERSIFLGLSHFSIYSLILFKTGLNLFKYRWFEIYSPVYALAVFSAMALARSGSSPDEICDTPHALAQ